jgi:hypothetical protein
MFKNWVIGGYRELEHFVVPHFRECAVHSLGKVQALHDSDFSGRIRLLWKGKLDSAHAGGDV